MTEQILRQAILRGEDSRNQFKSDIRSPEQLAAELVAFSNAEGGTIYLGVNDDGTIRGFGSPDIRRLNQMISNVASTFVRAPIALETENVDVGDGCQFQVVVRRPAHDQANESHNSLTPRQAKILSMIAADDRITVRALARELEINVSAVQSHLAALRGKGFLSREGRTRGKWIVQEV